MGGDYSTIDTGFEVFTGTRDMVEIELRPGQTHHLVAKTYVEERFQGPCKVGGYSLTRSQDSLGNDLVIVQVSTPDPPAELDRAIFLPIAQN